MEVVTRSNECDIPVQPGNILTQLGRHMTSDDFALFRKLFNSFNEDGTPNFESGFYKTLPEGAAT
jgi:hypothetical protein